MKFLLTVVALIMLSGCASLTSDSYTFRLDKVQSFEAEAGCGIVKSPIKVKVGSSEQKYWILTGRCKDSPSLDKDSTFRVDTMFEADHPNQFVGYVFMKQRLSDDRDEFMKRLRNSSLGLGGNVAVPIFNTAFKEDGVSAFKLFVSL